VFIKLARFATTKTITAHSTHSAITLPAREALSALRHMNTDCEKTEPSLWHYFCLPLLQVTLYLLWCAEQPPGCWQSWDSAVACLLRHSWGLSHASGMVIVKLSRTACDKQRGTANSSDPFSW